ncbi:MAG: hypothetical protein WAW92_00445 [Minisyncoccia bacterium]
MQDKIIKAVECFINNDIELLDLSAHEQAISHRIGVYLESIFESEKLSIDCEYNKHLNKPKEINLHDLDPELLKTCGCGSCKKIVARNLYEIPEKSFRPDIVIHSRGNDERNLVVIEVKKHKECLFDEAKLKALTRPKNIGGEYGYELGVFIWFIENKPQYKWFVA